MAVNCSVRRVDSAQQYIKGKYSSTVGLATSILGKVLLGTLKGSKRRKEVIKLCLKDIEQQFADRVAEDPRMEIEFMKAICSGGHPNFVRYIDSVEDRKRYCIVMEHVAGGDLCTHIQNLNHGIPDARSRRYAAQLAKAVYHMHCTGYCHLDLSLENVLWDKKADLLKICDFGLCRKLDSDADALFDSATIRPGKKGYMAPEIYAYQKFSGTKADVFSLGVLIFILLTGFPPFTTPNASDKCFQLMYYGKLEWLMEQWKLTDIISADCRALLARIFCPPKKRISLKEMLQHPWLGLDIDEVEKERMRYTASATPSSSDESNEASNLSAGDNKEQSPTASPAPAPAPPPAKKEPVAVKVAAAAAVAPVAVAAAAIVTRVKANQACSTQRRASTEGKKRKSMTIVKKKRLSKGNVKGKVRKKSIVKTNNSKVSASVHGNEVSPQQQGTQSRRRPKSNSIAFLPFLGGVSIHESATLPAEFGAVTVSPTKRELATLAPLKMQMKAKAKAKGRTKTRSKSLSMASSASNHNSPFQHSPAAVDSPSAHVHVYPSNDKSMSAASEQQERGGHRREESPSAGSLSSMSNGESDGSSHNNHKKSSAATTQRKASISSSAVVRTSHRESRTPPSDSGPVLAHRGALNDTQLITQRYQQRQQQAQQGLVHPADPFGVMDDNPFDNDRKEGNETYDPYLYQQQYTPRERSSISQHSNHEHEEVEAGAGAVSTRRLSLASDAGSVHSHHSHSHSHSHPAHAHTPSESEHVPEDDKHITPGPDEECTGCATNKDAHSPV